MIKHEINQKILEKAISLENWELADLAWTKEDAKALINSILQEEIGILGGDVCRIDNDELIHLGDNWSCDPEGQETQKEYFLRSKLKSLNYIEKYPISTDKKNLFVLVFTERPYVATSKFL